MANPFPSERSLVTQRRIIAPGLVTLRFHNPILARETLAGQFVNVLPKAGFGDPMLRRPFSVYWSEGDEAEIIVQAHGRGTGILAETREGDQLDVLGPLGKPWMYKSADYETAILLIGGVGVASMPMLTRALELEEISFQTFYGARTSSLIARDRLSNLHIATDDGTEGFHGSNVELLRTFLNPILKKEGSGSMSDRAGGFPSPKIFACGPTAMMRAAQSLAEEFGIPCELSLETEMACGIGICQGCPVLNEESVFLKSGRKFKLVCTDGPSFNAKEIVL
jgi:dihydroorotate dehydrogenase electron transfer subunit